MNYVFLDLEWNNAYCKKIHKNINEIIEIGAIKVLDNGKTQVFDRIIKSQITKRLGTRFKNLTNISNDIMREGISFQKAVDDFLEFCGNDFILITWSNSDLYAIAENFQVFLERDPSQYFSSYLDMQKYYQSIYKSDNGNQIALKSAAEKIGIDVGKLELHRASDDSKLTYMIFEKIKSLGDFRNIIVDTSKNNYFKRLLYRSFLIENINSPYLKHEDFIFECPNCGEIVDPLKKWRCHNKQFTNIFECKKCKVKFIGRVRIRKYYDYTVAKRSVVTFDNKASDKNNEHL